MRLPAPDFSSVDLVDQVVEERQGGRNAAFFRGLQPEWRTRVDEYINVAGSPEFVDTWPAIEPRKNSFLNLFKSPQEGSAQGNALTDLRDHELTMCPACGESGRPNTLDHYLPKGRYPHFCVTPHNLFPMCDACQTEKKEKTGDAHSPKFFIHPYFDDFAANQIVVLTVEPPFSTPTFALAPSPSLEPEQMALVECHLRELAVHQRYAVFFRGQYLRLLRSVVKMRESGQNVVESIEIFKTNAEIPSLNAWEHLFYDSVLSNLDLLNYLQVDELPDHL